MNIFALLAPTLNLIGFLIVFFGGMNLLVRAYRDGDPEAKFHIILFSVMVILIACAVIILKIIETRENKKIERLREEYDRKWDELFNKYVHCRGADSIKKHEEENKKLYEEYKQKGAFRPYLKF